MSNNVGSIVKVLTCLTDQTYSVKKPFTPALCLPDTFLVTVAIAVDKIAKTHTPLCMPLLY